VTTFSTLGSKFSSKEKSRIGYTHEGSTSEFQRLHDRQGTRDGDLSPFWLAVHFDSSAIFLSESLIERKSF